jgi:hypothetical protein
MASHGPGLANAVIGDLLARGEMNQWSGIPDVSKIEMFDFRES